jgi:hypothetical protein
MSSLDIATKRVQRRAERGTEAPLVSAAVEVDVAEGDEACEEMENRCSETMGLT